MQSEPAQDYNCNYSTEESPDEDSQRARVTGDTSVSQARDYKAPVVSLKEGMRARRGGVPTEAQAHGPAAAEHRHYFNEDRPSCRQVCRDYRESAQVACSWMPVLYVPYWLLVAGPPFILHLAARAVADLTERAVYFWAGAAVVLVFMFIIEFAH